MIPWEKLDQSLAAIGKDRIWLAENTPYSLESIRNAMAPASTRRTDRMLSVLSRAIEDEESRQHPGGPREIRPGVFDLFDLTTPEGEAEFALVDRASRIVQAPSIVDYCHDVLLAASERILAKERLGVYGEIPGIFPNSKVAEGHPTGSGTTSDPVESPSFPDAGAATSGSSPSSSGQREDDSKSA